MGDHRSARRLAVAAETWRQFFEFFMATRPQRDRVLQRLGLRPNDARALGTLEPKVGRTMRSLAEEWGCDASNATWIVDRLEKSGLAERRPLPGDRRVKLVVLTALGTRRRAELFRGMYEPPPELLELSAADLDALQSVLRKLPRSRPPGPAR